MASKKIKLMDFQLSLCLSFWWCFKVMIKAAKETVITILENPDVTDEELMTVFTGTEALINSRPLTYQSANPQDDASQDDTYPLASQIVRRNA